MCFEGHFLGWFKGTPTESRILLAFDFATRHHLFYLAPWPSCTRPLLRATGRFALSSADGSRTYLQSCIKRICCFPFFVFFFLGEVEGRWPNLVSAWGLESLPELGAL